MGIQQKEKKQDFSSFRAHARAGTDLQQPVHKSPLQTRNHGGFPKPDDTVESFLAKGSSKAPKVLPVFATDFGSFPMLAQASGANAKFMLGRERNSVHTNSFNTRQGSRTGSQRKFEAPSGADHTTAMYTSVAGGQPLNSTGISTSFEFKQEL